MDPSKYYCVAPYTKGAANKAAMVRSCAKGQQPHAAFRDQSYPNLQSCVYRCYTG